MTVIEAIEQLSEIENSRGKGVMSADVQVVALARVGREDQVLLAGTVGEFLAQKEEVNERLGGPLHSMVVCARGLHELEQEYLDGFRL